jgi:multiple sugar transport system ATP-binding protein
MGEVVFSNVTKKFDDGTIAVDNLSLTISEGEFVVLVGPSGCGKSTSLRMVAGLEEISAGEITINGEVVNGLTPRERDIAMVFQSYALYPHMTVAKNMAFPLRMAKIDAAEKTKRVERAAEILDITNLLERFPRDLSGGQRQRVAMGRAIVRSPRVFLMDEPLSNLDAKLRVQMRGEISHLQRELKTTTLYVTHDQVEAMTLGDRVAVMYDGVLQQLDAPGVLYSRPETVFVAGFIGSPPMNLCQARIERGNNELVVNFGDMSLSIDPASIESYPKIAQCIGQDVVLGTRPECFSVVDGDVPEGQRIRAKVDLVEMLGGEVLVYVDSDAKPVTAKTISDPTSEENQARGRNTSASSIVARLAPRVPPEAGEMVDLHYETDSLHFFDLKTGQALR